MADRDLITSIASYAAYGGLGVLVCTYVAMHVYRTWPNRALRVVLIGLAILAVRAVGSYIIPDFDVDLSSPESPVLRPNSNFALLEGIELAGRVAIFAGLLALWKAREPSRISARPPMSTFPHA
jgi:hypothetical protein